MDNILSISNVVQVDVSSVQSGIGTPNVNNIGFFTEETAGFAEEFRVYTSSDEVKTDFGSASRTYKMAVNVFSQSPNILSGGGRLIIFPMPTAVSAVIASTTTEALDSARLLAFQSISDGEFTIDIDGVSTDITGLDFTNAKSLDDVLLVIANQLPLVTCENNSGEFLFSSKKYGIDSTMVLSAFGAGSGTDITGATYLNIASATVVSGANSSGETLGDAVTRAKDLANFAGIMTTLQIENDKIEAFSSASHAGDFIAVLPFCKVTDIDGICKTIKDAEQTKVRSVLYSKSVDDSFLTVASYVGRAFSVNFSGVNTSSTMNMKKLVNIISDGGISQTYYELAKANGVDLYVNYAGDARVLSSGGNEFFDRVYNQLQLKFSMQTNAYNYLAQTNTKIPQTESGMDGLKDSLKKICEQFVRVGVIASGAWNSPDTFGNPEDFKRNISDYGYFIYSLPIAQQSQADRETRVAPLVQIAVKEAGAIHSVVINITSEA